MPLDDSKQPVFPDLTLNQAVTDLDAAVASLRSQTQEVEAMKESLKRDFRPRVIVFIDLVDSTKFKATYADEPYVWLSRLGQFTTITAGLIVACGGEVVKYIGDEVMAVFGNESSMINDAVSFVQRLPGTARALSEATGHKTELKVAVDFGDVAMLRYSGHGPADPQGTPVDRAARIGKWCQPNTILTSEEFVEASQEIPGLTFEGVGNTDFKGIGRTSVYQLGKATVQVFDTETLPASDLNALRSRVGELEKQVQQSAVREDELLEKNRQLREKITSFGKVIPESLVAKTEEEDECQSWWQEIEEAASNVSAAFDRIRNVGTQAHAHAIFEHLRNYGHSFILNSDYIDELEKYRIVESYGDGTVSLLTNSPRNATILSAVAELKSLIDEYDSDCPDAERLYEVKIDDPEFWREVIGITVL
jgi:class 3 adenylate cyclase